ncbi:MAG TPA: hypothetical protein VJU87_00675 [Gemmatimonadaceae bacterium]|nr:hypothetical protein [Gemmatimonadaceae bacterium]
MDSRRSETHAAHGRPTAEAYLVAIARSRLARAGLLDAGTPASSSGEEPERALYRLLRAQGGDAYARYNALLRELSSFLAAFDARLRRAAAP